MMVNPDVDGSTTKQNPKSLEHKPKNVNKQQPIENKKNTKSKI